MKAQYHYTDKPPKHRKSVKVTTEHGELFKVRLNRADRRAIMIDKGVIHPANATPKP
jgi:hypothetical protein